MEQQVKEDWIINNHNIFGLPKDIHLSISSIQYEILNQIEEKNINSISDYLGVEIEITNEIRFTQSLTIQTVFEEFLGFDNFNPLGQSSMNCYLILSYIQVSLLKEYYNENNKNILTFSQYRNQYNELLKKFLLSNIDTDEQDFIKAELNLCENLITELNKPFYNIISPLNKVLNKPDEFKKNLINSIDKRKKFLEMKAKEKAPKIKALFQFIEYLHSNIENFNQYNDLIKELEELNKERNKLNPENNYKDKLQYDRVQAELESKFEIIKENTTNLIIAKAKELNVCNFENEPNYSFNGIEAEIHQFKKNFNNEDLPLIFKHKSLYLEYRSQTHKTFLSLQFFFDELDEITKSLFDYFKDTGQNEYEEFETKSIQVNDVNEAIEQIQKGAKKVSFPFDSFDNTNVQQQSNIEQLPPQQSENQIEKLSDLITHKKSVEVVENVKVKYKNIKGKRLKLLLMAFQDLGLLPKDRIAQKFHNCCKIEFNWNIASYNAMNGYEFNFGIDNDELTEMKQYIETIIKRE
jgi:hypothetical protein